MSIDESGPFLNNPGFLVACNNNHTLKLKDCVASRDSSIRRRCGFFFPTPSMFLLKVEGETIPYSSHEFRQTNLPV